MGPSFLEDQGWFWIIYGRMQEAWSLSTKCKMKKIDKNTRYFIDLDLKKGKIIGWDYDHRERLARQKLKKPFYHRVYITKGQFNKLKDKYS